MSEQPLAIITGAGRGIGAATAYVLASNGYDVAICSRTQKELERTQSKILQSFPKSKVLCVLMDLSIPESIVSAFKEIEIYYKKSATALINNGAIAYPVDVLNCTAAQWDEFQNTNVRGAFICAQEFARLKLKYSPSQEAVLVNISSLGGLQGLEKFPGLTPYSVSKFGVTGLTELLSVEFKKLNIRVLGVAPGAVDTEMLKKAAPHLNTNTQPEDVAKIIAKLCLEKVSSMSSGQTLPLYTNLDS